MTIIVLTNCPPKLHGDMTKWMAEINTGVYVGKLSSRVRDELWKRICENIKVGQATMVFPAEGEQHLDFRVHNTTWEVVDFDGIKLMRRPSPEEIEKREIPILEEGFSNASKQKLLTNVQRASCKTAVPESFVVLDIETTGLDIDKDHIIEIAAIFVNGGKRKTDFSELVISPVPIPSKVSELTGLSNKDLNNNGKIVTDVLSGLLEFIGNNPIVCHNAVFDINFIQQALRKNNMPLLRNKIIDTLPLARKKIRGMSGYKLNNIAAYYEIEHPISHRALSDCMLTLDIFLRLNQS